MNNVVYEAEYTPQVIEDYRDNPFIEALPPIVSSATEAVKMLSVKPPYDESECELDTYYRLHCTMRLSRYFQPLYTHLDIEQRISRSIRQGYVNRNPMSPAYIERIRKCNEAAKNKTFDKTDFRSVRSTAMGFTMIGMSGVGKTTAVERVLSHYPQCITHTNYKDNPFYIKQVVWMKLDCPYDGSIKGLCLSFFNELDRILDTNYSDIFIASRYTVDTMLIKMSHLASTHGLGLLVIDEIQHLSQAKSGGSEKMLNFFVTLVNTIGVPVVLIGTSKALPILQSEFRQARRGSGQGDLIWEHLKNDESWEIMLGTMWKYQWTKEKSPLTDEIKNVLYEETQGIIDLAVKLYAISQLKAICDGTEKITADIIKESAAESLRLVKPMIAALRSGNPKEIIKYEDIRPINIEEHMSKYIGKISMPQVSENQNTLEELAILKLVDLGINAKEAQFYVKRVIQSKKEGSDVNTIVQRALKMLYGAETVETDSIQNYTDNDLRKAAENDSYEFLKSTGAIAGDKDEW